MRTLIRKSTKPAFICEPDQNKQPKLTRNRKQQLKIDNGLLLYNHFSRNFCARLAGLLLLFALHIFSHFLWETRWFVLSSQEPQQKPWQEQSQDLPQTQFSLQFNAKTWQLLNWQELRSLSGMRRDNNGVQRAVPLNELYPDLKRLDYIELRNQRGEATELSVKSLKEVSVELGSLGKFWIIANGQRQGAAEQLDVHGETHERATLHIWAEQDFEFSFLRTALEIYERFHNLKIELRIFKNLLQTLSWYLGRNSLPDMILATRKTTFLLRNLLQGQPPENDYTIAYSELFVQNGQHYSLPIAMQPWSLVYNLDLIDFSQTGAPAESKAENPVMRLKLSEFFAQMQALHAMQNGVNNPYMLGLGDEIIPFSLLLHSFLQPNTKTFEGLQSGLQYLRRQRQMGLLRKFDYVEERFAKGQIAAIISRTRNWKEILHTTKTEGNKSIAHSRIRIIPIPYNDLSGNDIPRNPRIWSLGILRSSMLQAQAESLRRYLSGAAVQSQLDLSNGIFPSNTAYYSFYQKSAYYALLPEAERRYAMNPDQVWEHDIQHRDIFRQIEELNRQFGSQIDLLLINDSPLPVLPMQMEMPKESEIQMMGTGQPLFLR